MENNAKNQMSQGNTKPQPTKNQVYKSANDSAKKQKYARRSPKSKQPLATNDELRPVFAAYFNMARANLYSVLRYISVQCGLEVKHDEDSMHELPVANLPAISIPK